MSGRGKVATSFRCNKEGRETEGNVTRHMKQLRILGVEESRAHTGGSTYKSRPLRENVISWPACVLQLPLQLVERLRLRLHIADEILRRSQRKVTMNYDSQAVL